MGCSSSREDAVADGCETEPSRSSASASSPAGKSAAADVDGDGGSDRRTAAANDEADASLHHDDGDWMKSASEVEESKRLSRASSGQDACLRTDAGAARRDGDFTNGRGVDTTNSAAYAQARGRYARLSLQESAVSANANGLGDVDADVKEKLNKRMSLQEILKEYDNDHDIDDDGHAQIGRVHHTRSLRSFGSSSSMSYGSSSTSPSPSASFGKLRASKSQSNMRTSVIRSHLQEQEDHMQTQRRLARQQSGAFRGFQSQRQQREELELLRKQDEERKMRELQRREEERRREEEYEVRRRAAAISGGSDASREECVRDQCRDGDQEDDDDKKLRTEEEETLAPLPRMRPRKNVGEQNSNRKTLLTNGSHALPVEIDRKPSLDSILQSQLRAGSSSFPEQSGPSLDGNGYIIAGAAKSAAAKSPSKQAYSRSELHKEMLDLAGGNNCREAYPQGYGLTPRLSEILLMNVVDVNEGDQKNGHTALHRAAAGGNSKTVSLLLGQDAIDVKRSCYKGLTPLMLSVRIGNMTCVRLFLEHEDTDVGLTDVEGNSALIWSAIESEADIMALILESPKFSRSGDVNAADNDGNVPIHLAAFNGSKSCMQLLLHQKGIEASKANSSSGGTALHYSAANGHLDCLELLLGREEVEVNATNLTDGNTPLHLASQFGREACTARLLADPRINASVRNKHGKTALELAGNDDAVRRAFSEVTAQSPSE